MPPAGFEPTIPASERPQTHALDRAATGLSWHDWWYCGSMLPQYQINIRKLICKCFLKKCDFSKEQYSSLKMILGSKHVGAILNVLM